MKRHREYWSESFLRGGHPPDDVAYYFNSIASQEEVNTFESKTPDSDVEYLCFMDPEWHFWSVIRKESDGSCSFGRLEHHDITRWYYQCDNHSKSCRVNVWDKPRMRQLQDSGDDDNKSIITTMDFLLNFRRVVTEEQYIKIQKEDRNMLFEDVMRKYRLGRNLSKSQKQFFVLAWNKSDTLSKLPRYIIKDITKN